MVVIDRDAVRRLLPMHDCIGIVADALAALDRGEAGQPLRTVVRPAGGDDTLYVMPGWTGSPPTQAVKLLTLVPANAARGLPTHQGVVIAFDPATGGPAALIDAAALTAIRTAAVSAVATDRLARPDAGDLALLGSGVQAASHLEAIACVRALRRVRVWSPTRAHRESFAREHTRSGEPPVEAVEDAETAVRGADIICAVTASPTPVVRGDWLGVGAHINAVGASTADTRELDAEAVRRARFYVDSAIAALAESGDLLMAVAEGAVDERHIAGELGEVLTGAAPGRRTDDEITVFESLGLAVEDAATAAALLRRAAHEPALPRIGI